MLSTTYRAGRFPLLLPPSAPEIHLTPYGQSPDRPRLNPRHISSRSALVLHLPLLDPSTLPQTASRSPRSSATLLFPVAPSVKIYSLTPCLHIMDRTRLASAYISFLWDRQHEPFVLFLLEYSGLAQDVASVSFFPLWLSSLSLPRLTSPPASSILC